MPSRPLDLDIGLLIGTNVPKALEPWEVIKSEGDGPYAVKMVLAWSVNGPLKGCSEGLVANSTISVNRTVCSIPTLEEQLRDY